MSVHVHIFNFLLFLACTFRPLSIILPTFLMLRDLWEVK